MKKRKNIQWVYWLLAMAVLVIMWVIFRYYEPVLLAQKKPPTDEPGKEQFLNLTEIPAYSGSPYCEVNDNIPYFKAEEYPDEAFENYSETDTLGRCGTALAYVCRELMPTQERGLIGQVKPTGWQYAKYDFIDGKYLYNRCHLIGYQLTGENANRCNLITGTRYLNVEGMLPFENQVAEYVRHSGEAVLYRVTPCFAEDNLLATGVLLEAWSVADEGESICFNVFCYNVQPGVEIDYATGESHLEQHE